MTAARLVARLRAADVRLAVVGGRLRVDAPRGVLTDADREALRAHKAEILALLHALDAEARAGDGVAVLVLDDLMPAGAMGPRPVPAWRVVVERCTPVPGPITLNAWTTITDPVQCIEADLATVAHLIAARNAGREHDSVEPLLAEALGRLALCGVALRLEAVQ
jgi:TubC N-terminal docking domain